MIPQKTFVSALTPIQRYELACYKLYVDTLNLVQSYRISIRDSIGLRIYFICGTILQLHTIK